MNQFQSHANAFARVQEQLAANCPVIVWNGQNIQTIPGSAMLAQKLGVGGFAVDYDQTFYVLASEFFSPSITTAQAAKNALQDTPLTYLGDLYKISSVDILPGGLQLVIHANALNQAA